MDIKRNTILLLICFMRVAHVSAQDTRLGKVNFMAIGDEVAQPYFQKGLLLLHNFEYTDAAQEFEMAQLLDPNFVMAYWGEAMCYNHPTWFQQDFEKGKGALFKLGVKASERKEKAHNEIENGFISSIEFLFGEDPNIKVRNEKYETAMAELYSQHPEHEEVAAFYALSLMGNCYTGQEKEKLQLAGRVLMKTLAVNPDHPGALNYQIQLYSNPSEAYKANKAADHYFSIARDSRYALHAPSHIYLPSGQWDKLIKSNEAAWEAAEAWVSKKNRSLENRDYHSLWWLQYGYLQSGEWKKGLELVKNLHWESRYSKSERIRFHVAMMRGHYLAETGNWLSDVAEIEIPTRGFSVSVKSMCLFVDAMHAIEKHDLPKVEWYLNQMADQRTVDQNREPEFNDFRSCSSASSVRTTGLEQELTLAEVMEWELRALKAIEQNKLDEAVAHITRAIALEDETMYEDGPSVILIPSHEIFGQILVSQGKNTEAVEQFNVALQRAPNRTRSLLGRYRALQNLGETQKAGQVKKMIMANWVNADALALSQLN